MRLPRIVAIGGGGVTHGEDPGLDAFCLEQVGPRPRLGYIGTASGDAPDRIARFHDRFGSVASQCSHLPEAADAEAAAAWLAGLDLVYAGGGSTARLLDGWRTRGIGALLAEAGRTGTVLAGVSAGAMCWFDIAFSMVGGSAAPRPGLGLVPGTCCPHASGEPERLPAFRAAVAAGRVPAGVAIDDGAAVLFVGGRVAALRSERPGAGARRLEPDGAGGVSETVLGPS